MHGAPAVALNVHLVTHLHNFSHTEATVRRTAFRPGRVLWLEGLICPVVAKQRASLGIGAIVLVLHVPIAVVPAIGHIGPHLIEACIEELPGLVYVVRRIHLHPFIINTLHFDVHRSPVPVPQCRR
jgi:hypothetical protein